MFLRPLTLMKKLTLAILEQALIYQVTRILVALSSMTNPQKISKLKSTLAPHKIWGESLLQSQQLMKLNSELKKKRRDKPKKKRNANRLKQRDKDRKLKRKKSKSN